MEKRAFYTKGEKVSMKWHIAPSNSARSYLRRKRCIFQIFLLVAREYHIIKILFEVSHGLSGCVVYVFEDENGFFIEQPYTCQEERQMVIAEKFASNQGTMGNIGGAVGGFMMGGAMGGSIVDIARSALDPEKNPTEKPPKNVSGTSSHVGQAPSSIKVNEIPKNQRKSPCGTSGFFSGAPP